jgi:hypothetical protein
MEKINESNGKEKKIPVGSKLLRTGMNIGSAQHNWKCTNEMKARRIHTYRC